MSWDDEVRAPEAAQLLEPSCVEHIPISGHRQLQAQLLFICSLKRELASAGILLGDHWLMQYPLSSSLDPHASIMLLPFQQARLSLRVDCSITAAKVAQSLA